VCVHFIRSSVVVHSYMHLAVKCLKKQLCYCRVLLTVVLLIKIDILPYFICYLFETIAFIEAADDVSASVRWSA